MWYFAHLLPLVSLDTLTPRTPGFSYPPASGTIAFLGCKEDSSGITAGKECSLSLSPFRSLALFLTHSLSFPFSHPLFPFPSSSPSLSFSPFLTLSFLFPHPHRNEHHPRPCPYLNIIIIIIIIIISAPLILTILLSSSLIGASIVFKLSSEITGRQPVKKINRTVHQYEPDSVQLNIINPLLKTGNFLIKLIITSNKISVDEFILTQKGMLYVRRKMWLTQSMHEHTISL